VIASLPGSLAGSLLPEVKSNPEVGSLPAIASLPTIGGEC
jgi:hypothetical protein